MTTRSDDKEAGQDGEATDGKRPAPRVVEVPPELRVAQGARSLVAIVGRPNVGKSTLFNRLVGKHVAIVQDEPGVTRDRHYADAEVRGRPYVLVDTGGFDPEGKDPVVIGIRKQVRAALAEAELAVFVYDATQPLQDADRIAVQLLRESGRPVLWVANKADSPKADADALALYELGVDRVIPVSALHGRGTMELEGALFDRIPAPREADLVLDESTSRVAVVGRPNAGKSSLINRLVGQDRLIVDARPGTTTDSIDTLVEKNGRKYVFVDTAGIRRKRAVSAPVEMTSVLQAIRAMERADVVVVLFDATEGALSEQDLRIIGLAVDRGRAVILGMNKFDLLDAAAERKVVAEARERISFASWIPIVKLSAKAGRGTHTLLQMIDRVYDSYRRRVGTGEVNRFFEEVLDKHPPPAQSGRSVRLYYVTQVATRPPRFAAITNHPEYIAPSYDRYLQNQLRERFAFEGVPIRVGYRAKRRREFVDKDDE